ncbi:hypothetical protein AB0K09_20325 [Streptomyces sp. NPDC049577]|uniref:hypothetical protein n=1 Tax=Streptomyces sp. NPDC049577 TaxID=3155153 RepID=UPI003448A7BE
MTTEPTSSSRARPLGQGVSALIPATASPAHQAAALIAAVQDVRLPAALVQAAALLLDAAAGPEPLDVTAREQAAAVAALLAKAASPEL